MRGDVPHRLERILNEQVERTCSGSAGTGTLIVCVAGRFKLPAKLGLAFCVDMRFSMKDWKQAFSADGPH